MVRAEFHSRSIQDKFKRKYIQTIHISDKVIRYI